MIGRVLGLEENLFFSGMVGGRQPMEQMVNTDLPGKGPLK